MGPIVYIDDEAMLCKLFERILRVRVSEVRTFTEPTDAITYIRAHPVAAIVCDYRMPTLSGLELLARIESDLIARDIPFFLVSGDLGIASQVRDHPRISGVLTKPFRAEALIALLSTARTDTSGSEPR